MRRSETIYYKNQLREMGVRLNENRNTSHKYVFKLKRKNLLTKFFKN